MEQFDLLVERLRRPAHGRAAHSFAHQSLGDFAHLSGRNAIHVCGGDRFIDFRGATLVSPEHLTRGAVLPRARDVQVEVPHRSDQASEVTAIPIALATVQALPTVSSNDRANLLLEERLQGHANGTEEDRSKISTNIFLGWKLDVCKVCHGERSSTSPPREVSLDWVSRSFPVLFD